MEYRKSEYIGDYNVDEVFEGTPREILEVLNGIGSNEGDIACKILKQLGIRIFDRKSRLRNMENIFNDLSNVFNEDKGLIYDQEEAIRFIDEKLVGVFGDTKRVIKQVLDLEEEYM